MKTHLHHPAVRDLAAVIGAPSLVRLPGTLSDSECATQISLHEDRLKTLDAEPEPLLSFLAGATRSHRLGHYFEALVAFWISHVVQAPRWRSGVRVDGDRDVKGELDIVFDSPDGNGIQHWEAAVKLYLCARGKTAQANPTMTDFVGPMGKDRLSQKTERLFERQLTLPRTPEGQAALAAQGFTGPVESRALVKGALFYPLESDWRRHPHPPEVSPAHARGWWSRGFIPEAHEPDSLWVELPRLRWLSPFDAPRNSGLAPLSISGIQDYCRAHFARHGRALLLSRVRLEDGRWREIDRGFVVHDAALAGWINEMDESFHSSRP